MRTYDIPYVKNPAPPTSVTADIDSLDLKTLTRTYLCGKSHGRISECLKCPAPCAYGKRALELANPTTASFPPPPLIDGKTLLERAREDAKKSRTEKKIEEQPEEKKSKPAKLSKNGHLYIEDWYEKAKESGDPLHWVMETYNMTERKAKNKFYNFWISHPEKKEPLWGPVKTATVKTKEETPVVPEAAVETPAENKDELLSPLEEKINDLMNKQEEYKSQYEHYLKLYQETKTKVDALYEALNILNE